MHRDTRYTYSTTTERGAFSAYVWRDEPGKLSAIASYQSGFRNRTAAYRYARQMARALNRNHAWMN